MRVASRFPAILPLPVLLGLAGPLPAAFHHMRISEVMVGGGGSPKIQFIELEMTLDDQRFVQGVQVFLFDAAGNQAGSFTFPRDLARGALGSRILIGTPEFAAVSTVEPDFLLPAGLYLPPSGRLSYEGAAIESAIDSVAYGDYTGDNTGYGTPAALPPLSELKSLTRTRTESPPNNSTDFTAMDPTPTNSQGRTGTVNPPQEAPALGAWGIAFLSLALMAAGARALRRPGLPGAGLGGLGPDPRSCG